MGWWMVLMGIFWLLFWASLIYLFVVAIVRPARLVVRVHEQIDVGQRHLRSSSLRIVSSSSRCAASV